MESLKNYIDFSMLVSVNRANPNGDPRRNNCPRVDSANYGVISPYCLQYKLRRSLQRMGEHLYIQDPKNTDDGKTCLYERALSDIGVCKTNREFLDKAKKTWFDARSLGATFAYSKSMVSGKKKTKDESEEKGFSDDIVGCVTFRWARSIAPVHVSEQMIVKSVNTENRSGNSDDRDSDTMGVWPVVDHGLYRVDGSIDSVFAKWNGFTEDDAEKLKQAMRYMFVGDESAMRPDGSMEVAAFYWWRHSDENQYIPPWMVWPMLEVKNNVKKPLFLYEYDIKLLDSPNLKYLNPKYISALKSLKPEIVVPFDP